MILITGATGQLGKAVIGHLLAKGFPSSELSALVRDLSRAEELADKGISLRTGDYRDYDSLLKAFIGVDKLLLVSSSDMQDRSSQHINAIRAAKAAGVRHIVYTSFQRKNEVNSPIQFISAAHLDAEREIRASGMTYTILQNGLYADLIPWFLGEKVFETGVFLPAGEGRAAFTLRNDMAEATANVLTGSGHEDTIYQLATNETISFREIAGILSEFSGKAIEYTSPDVDVFVETLKKSGVPDWITGMFAGFGVAIAQGEFDFQNNDLEALLQRKPVTMKAFLQSVYAPAVQ